MVDCKGQKLLTKQNKYQEIMEWKKNKLLLHKTKMHIVNIKPQPPDKESNAKLKKPGHKSLQGNATNKENDPLCKRTEGMQPVQNVQLQ